jgi:hypothetical protein
VEIQAETGTVYSSSDGNDNDLPTIKEILYTALQKKGFVVEDQGLNNTALGVEGATSKEKGRFINHSRSALGDTLGRSLGKRACYLCLWK